jgi:cell division protein FtsX
LAGADFGAGKAKTPQKENPLPQVISILPSLSPSVKEEFF